MSSFSTGQWPVPRTAYVHVPFCRHRCGYCNFSVVAGRDDLFDRYLAAVSRELESLKRPTLDTLFIGGGTPTHFDVERLQQFLLLMRQRFTFAVDYEWSIEANPEDITHEKVALLAEFGVNRISLGIQSFDEDKLRILERGHAPQDAMDAVQTAAELISNVSIDLIFAVPDETIEQWLRDLEVARQLPVNHLSTYALTVEKGTSFWSRRARGELSGVGECCEVEMYQMARNILQNSGFQHYEISSFAQSGSRCQHNLAYWKGNCWYAAGPGAARFVDGRREVNHRSTTSYLRRVESGQSPTAELAEINPEQFARERAAFGIRMIEGIDIEAIEKETGFALGSVCRNAIVQSVEDGLLVQPTPSRIKLSERGILFADTVASRFLGP